MIAEWRESSERGGIFLNIDINSVVMPFLNALSDRPGISEADLYPFVDQYAGTHVQDLAFNIFCQYSNPPSAVFTDAMSKYAQREENGIPVDYSNYYRGIKRFYLDSGIDVYAVWLARTRAQGMRSWLSVRMNDCHCPDDPASFLRGSLFYEARRNGWMIGPRFGYYRHCLDYRVPEVRGLMLAYIEEQLERYDVDGLELDWLREVYCLADPPNGVDQINRFVGDVRALTNRAARHRGHPVRLLVRLMRDVDQNLAFGFDVRTWLREQWVNAVAVSPRWASCDSGMPIADWKKLCASVPVMAGLETLVCRQNSRASATAAVARGYAAQYLAQGADQIYLYNYFTNPLQPSPEQNKCHQTCGYMTTIENLSRRHVVTGQDICPPGFIPDRPLPRELPPGASAEWQIRTGPTDPLAQQDLIVGFETGVDTLAYLPNIRAVIRTAGDSPVGVRPTGEPLERERLEDGQSEGKQPGDGLLADGPPEGGRSENSQFVAESSAVTAGCGDDKTLDAFRPTHIKSYDAIIGRIVEDGYIAPTTCLGVARVPAPALADAWVRINNLGTEPIQITYLEMKINR